MDIELLGAAVVAAFVVMRLVESIVKPIWERVGLDPFWLVYVAMAIGAGLAWFTAINAFPIFSPVNPLVGRILTCLVIGLGPSFIFDLLDGPSPTE